MNVVGVLEYFDKFLVPRDYIIVEDTTPEIGREAGQGLFEELGYDEWGPAKMNYLKEFMKDRSDKYVVDQHYTDFFG